MEQHHNKTEPIEEESSVTRQCLEVAIHDLHQYMTWDYPESIRGYDDLQKIMQTLQDAYEALDTQVMENPVFTVAATLEALYNPTTPVEQLIEASDAIDRQSVGVAIGILDEVIHTIKNPQDYIIEDPTHLEALEEIMTHLEDSYNAKHA